MHTTKWKVKLLSDRTIVIKKGHTERSYRDPDDALAALRTSIFAAVGIEDEIEKKKRVEREVAA